MHQAPVGFLLPGGQVDLFQGDRNGFFQVSGLLVILAHPFQRGQALALQLVAHPLLPFVKQRAVFQPEAFQKRSAVERDAFFQAFDGLVRGGQAAEGVHIHPAAPAEAELKSFPVGGYRRNSGFTVANGFAQISQGIAQIGQGRGIRPIRPEQPGQGFTAVRSVQLDRQVSQQRPHPVGFKAGDRFSVQRRLKRTQQGEHQPSHPYPTFSIQFTLIIITPPHNSSL